MTKFIYSYLLFIFIGTIGNSQELNVKVDINAPINTIVDPKLFEEFRTSVYEFYNFNKWTEDEFKDIEKIDAQVTITVTKESGPNSFTVDLLVQSRRPVYKSNYTTPMLNYKDSGIDVVYNPGQPLQQSHSSYFDNISSILTFYGYIILGYDYDSFSPLGGEDHFLKARDVITALPPSISQSSGWDGRGGIVGRNRFWIQENLLSAKMKPFRQFLYEYHRLGLDGLYEDPDRQRAVIASAISSLQPVLDNYPNNMIMQLFSESKADEIVNIFAVADRGQKQKVYDVMVQCSPFIADKYRQLSR